MQGYGVFVITHARFVRVRDLFFVMDKKADSKTHSKNEWALE
jgi:hypothetical protein